jgi:hypothetical protein
MHCLNFMISFMKLAPRQFSFVSNIYIWYPAAQSVLSYSQDAVAPLHFRISIYTLIHHIVLLGAVSGAADHEYSCPSHRSRGSLQIDVYVFQMIITNSS